MFWIISLYSGLFLCLSVWFGLVPIRDEAVEGEELDFEAGECADCVFGWQVAGEDVSGGFWKGV